jgi:hypothetical protein
MDDKDKILANVQFFGCVHGQLTQGRGKTMDAFFSLIPYPYGQSITSLLVPVLVVESRECFLVQIFRTQYCH